jgi:hypothetical protein
MVYRSEDFAVFEWMFLGSDASKFIPYIDTITVTNVPPTEETNSGKVKKYFFLILTNFLRIF